MDQALSGIRVLDATRALAGPFCTMMLGDLGADVIKIEMPGSGDETRYWGPPFAGNAGATFVGFNRNKRGLALDLHTDEGRERFLQLARRSDVVIENFRPGTMRKFGVDYEAVSKVRPDVVYCSISGYGQSGPLSSRPAMDLMVQAVSGVMSLTGEPEGRPCKAAAPICDVMAGFSAAFAIMGALRLRESSGAGRYIDIAMLDAMLPLLGQSVTALSMTGKAPRRHGNGHPLMAPYQSFRTATREIVISVTNEKTWLALCRIGPFAHLREDADFLTQPDRNANRERLCAEIEAIFLERPGEQWLTLLDEQGVPAEPVNTLPEILAHPHIAHRDGLLEVEYPPGSGERVAVPGMPWRDVVTRTRHLDPPDLGQHDAEILALLDLPARGETV